VPASIKGLRSIGLFAESGITSDHFLAIPEVRALLSHIPYIGPLLWILFALLGLGERLNEHGETVESLSKELQDRFKREDDAAYKIAESFGIEPWRLSAFESQTWQLVLGKLVHAQNEQIAHDSFVRDLTQTSIVLDEVIKLNLKVHLNDTVMQARLDDLFQTQLPHLRELMIEVRDGVRLLNRSNEPVLRLKRPIPSTENEFYFVNQAFDELFGREKELRHLKDFLVEPEMFRWMSIYGHGGEGKSRLALKLVDFALRTGWRAGFVDSRKAHQILNGWEPERPTLIVVDYVFLQEADFWRDTCLYLLENQGNFEQPVRLLLLDRTSGGSWWQAFFDEASQGPRDALTESRFGEPMLLGPLEDAPLLELFEFALGSELGDLQNEVLRSLKRLLSSDAGQGSNPPALFVLLAADSMKNGLQPRQWTRERILHSVVDRMYVHWRKAGLTEEHLNWLFYATLIRESDFKSYPRSSVCSCSADQLFSLSNYSDSAPPRKLSLKALVPDPLGEFFVLERLADAARLNGNTFDDVVASAATELLGDAHGGNAERVLDFIARASTDYPDHPAWKRFSDLAINELNLSSLPIRKLSFLSLFTNLQKLVLTNTQVGDAGLEHLTALTNLQELDLDGTRVGDSGLEHLAALTNLIWLHLNDTQVGDAGLEHLSALTNLQFLGLDNTQVGDSGLEHLAALTNLQELYLNNTQVGDAGLAKT